MNGGEGRLGFSFTPTPERAIRAVAHGRIDLWDYLLIAFFYERANTTKLIRREETPTLTLRQIRDGVGWRYTDDALSKRIRRLQVRRERWFSYRIEGRDQYVLTLHPDQPQRSEFGPRSQSSLGPSSGETEAEDRSGAPASEDGDLSETGSSAGRPSRPRSARSRPSSDAPTNDSAEPFSDNRTASPVRDPQTLQREQDLSLTERSTENSLNEDHGRPEEPGDDETDRLLAGIDRRDRKREGESVAELIERLRRAQALRPPREAIDWPDNSAVDSEAALLADVQALVDAGLWVET